MYYVVVAKYFVNFDLKMLMFSASTTSARRLFQCSRFEK